MAAARRGAEEDATEYAGAARATAGRVAIRTRKGAPGAETYSSGGHLIAASKCGCGAQCKAIAARCDDAADAMGNTGAGRATAERRMLRVPEGTHDPTINGSGSHGIAYRTFQQLCAAAGWWATISATVTRAAAASDD